jgi:hypothetical protein
MDGGPAAAPAATAGDSIELLFRFRNLVAETISEHRAVIADKGCCWWGWWKRPLENARIDAWRQLQNAAPKLILLAFAITLTQLAALPVENRTRQTIKRVRAARFRRLAEQRPPDTMHSSPPASIARTSTRIVHQGGARPDLAWTLR